MDANVLVYAFRRDAERHSEFSDWLENGISGTSPIGYAEIVLSSFVRIVTHPKIFAKPSTAKEAFAFTDEIKKQTNAIRIAPQENHWNIFRRLCVEAEAKGNLVPDAYLAALAMESGSTWITCDRDFARFKGLKWRHPLDD
ncbi:MAG TPA: type II toxin-antitoxin system VapC family toxin [Fibrobacteria bacterium]|nr:type II toxin-antitoxin system VapC family toxin [Fibrobacteria bacterium]